MADELIIDSKALIFATLADVYLSSGMVDEAISILKDGLSRNPNYTLGKIILGRAYYMKGNVDEALKTLEALYPEAKDSENANLYLARCHKRIGDLDKAAQFYEIVLKINPQNKDARQELDSITSKPAAVPPKAEEPVIETTSLPPTIKEAAVVAVPIMEEPVIVDKKPPAEKIDQPAEPPAEEPVIPIVDTIPQAMLREQLETEKEAPESAPPAAEPKDEKKEPPIAEKKVEAKPEFKPEPMPQKELTRAEKVAEIEELLNIKKPEIESAIPPEKELTIEKVKKEIKEKVEEKEKERVEEKEEVPILPEIGFEIPSAAIPPPVQATGVSPLDTLKEPMSHLLKLKAVKGAFICSRDGLLIQNSYEARADIEEIAALIAAICNEADDSFKFLKEGAMEKCIIEKGDESVCVVTAGESLLCIVTKPEAKPGLVFVYARKIIEQIREILG